MARTWQNTGMVRNISDDGRRRGMLNVDPPAQEQLVFSMNAAEAAVEAVADGEAADAELRLLSLSECEYSKDSLQAVHSPPHYCWIK